MGTQGDESPQSFLGIDDEVLASLLAGVTEGSQNIEAVPPERVMLSVEIGVLELSLNELYRARSGDVFALTAHSGGELIVTINGEPLWKGQLMRCAGALSIQLDTLE